MENIEKISNYIIPLFILIVFIIGIKEKKDVFNLFINGVEDGIKSTVKIIPIIIAFFFFSGVLISSDIINKMFNYFMNNENNIKYVVIVSIIKSFSGSAGISFGIDILKRIGVDSPIGMVLSIILGATETTMYVASIYLGRFKDKDILPVITLGLICDIFVLLLTLSMFIDIGM